jgi:two-component system response regulator AtoC
MMAAIASVNGFKVRTAGTLDAARRSIEQKCPDVLLLDVHLPDGNGLSLLDHHALACGTGIVLMTGHASLASSIDALRRGALDYLVKPVDSQRLRDLLIRLRRPLPDASNAPASPGIQAAARVQMLGSSPAMRQVAWQIERVAPTSMPVLITGESGTGKELAALSIHAQSLRRNGPFVALNCAAMSPSLIESELFGHERGSFTGAERLRHGYFETADGGTLFLDEITEMQPSLQVKLLRLLETGTFQRVGSTELLKADVRIVAASNRRTDIAVGNGELRNDLFHRISAFPLHLPPLRERRGDIPLLARHFLAEICRQARTNKTLPPEAEECLARHAWPGNARELRNVIQRAHVLSDGNELDVRWLQPPGQCGTVAMAEGFSIAPGLSLAAAEERLIMATLAHCEGHKEKTAAVLGISLKTLYNKLRGYNIPRQPAAPGC